jgi:hypothetical protein
MRNDAEQVQRIGIARVVLQNLPITLFGFGQAAGLMMLYGLRQLLAYERGRHRPVRSALFAIHEAADLVHGIL